MIKYLMTDIFYKEDEKSWKRFSVSEGDPTGRIYSFWLPDELPPIMEKIIEFLNSQITCTCEPTIDPYILKFNLLRSPEVDEENYGYWNQDKWESTSCIFEKKNFKQNQN